MSTYPVNLYLRGRRCVVMGGGRVAQRKVSGLLDAGAEVVIVSPALTPALAQFADAGQIAWTNAPYDADCLDGATLVFAATDNAQVNTQIVTDAQERGVLVNSASDPDDGDFTTPASVRRGPLMLNVSTEGASPTLSAVVREMLEEQFGPEWEPLTAILSRLRPVIQSLDDEGRRVVVRRIVSNPDVRTLLRAGDLAGAETCARALVLK